MPALIEEEHPACAGLITAYKKCSATTSLLRKVFTSECTALKYQLDRCFQQEKLARTHHNLARRQELLKRLAEIKRARASEAS